MNDCFWYYIVACAECPSYCSGCQKYISINNSDGMNLVDEWDELVAKTLLPVRTAFILEKGWAK